MIIIRIYGKNNNAVLFLPKEQRQSFYSKQDRFVREAKKVFFRFIGAKNSSAMTSNGFCTITSTPLGHKTVPTVTSI